MPILAKLGRQIRYRLFVPMARARHPPEHLARGIMVGLAWAFTPLIGVQMYGVVLTWLVARRLFGWHFHLLLALAWTWVTNVLTLVPTYYVFHLTGQVMLGRWDDLSGYAAFQRVFARMLDPELGLLAGIWAAARLILSDWGVAMAVGCIPWAVTAAWLGYRWGLASVVRLRVAKARRMQARRDGRDFTAATDTEPAPDPGSDQAAPRAPMRPGSMRPGSMRPGSMRPGSRPQAGRRTSGS